MAALSLNQPGPVDAAVKRYEAVKSYSVTLDSRSEKGGELIRYYFKKPGFVRMEFIEPHSGAVLVYDPVKKEALLRPLGFFKSFVMRLKPEDRLIRSSGGHTVDESDLGALFKNVEALQKGGTTAVLGDTEEGDKAVTEVLVEGAGRTEVDGYHGYRLWLDKTTHLPVKVISYDTEGHVVEEVRLEDLKTDVNFPDGFFSIE